MSCWLKMTYETERLGFNLLGSSPLETYEPRVRAIVTGMGAASSTTEIAEPGPCSQATKAPLISRYIDSVGTT
jgi:hypothetical protein